MEVLNIVWQRMGQFGLRHSTACTFYKVTRGFYSEDSFIPDLYMHHCFSLACTYMNCWLTDRTKGSIIYSKDQSLYCEGGL